ncbi:glycoside hydrolase family 88 protein [Lactiplantibacillus mudanjiangensis]|uniref:Glycosyl hydrolase family 88 [Lactobacillus sp.] n=1 Tax=Lactiplantibacillus mudanjiangensis TaxID=1296538 RepID=A0A660DVD8_9LACO|nr:glycoside hydrolase family 88 protein [Lactiplantibacillus mudanjiangensis]VDG22568.1 glycosyl hydrolase family 88 [Lactobacillus sp.] [Lactiplantibacillus mudanjiangensis]VDG26896.1 glycosyl hydrolase family 88 [Lactobacillus sp.] [Lactiplantibacillus mudanjiangensis]
MENYQEFAQNTLTKVTTKMAAVIKRNTGIIPYTTDDQHHFINVLQKDPFWWTNGFWGGIMWELYHLTGDDIYHQQALAVEDKLDANLMSADHLDHDNGFKWLLTSVAHFQDDHSEQAHNRALLAANNMAGRFNLAGHYFRAWNDEDGRNRADLAIIDCLMNLPLLYWASETEKDPRFKQMAYAHALTTQKEMVRPDGSVKHIGVFNPENGDYLHSQGGQGYGHGSSWTRGQAWGIYGFTLSYTYTHDASFLATAQRIANYFIANIPTNGHIPIDFRQPADPWLEDASAATIAASGLLALADQVDTADKAIYRDAAIRLLKTLADSGTDWNENHDAFITHCSAEYHEDQHEYPIIYADYFFIEALMKLADKDTAFNPW